MSQNWVVKPAKMDMKKTNIGIKPTNNLATKNVRKPLDVVYITQKQWVNRLVGLGLVHA